MGMRRALAALGWGGGIGALGGLVGLGGAEFRLPVLVSRFGLPTLQAVIANKALSLVVVAFAWVFRGVAVPHGELWAHADVVLNLLAGSLLGAWWGAGQAMRWSRQTLDRVIGVLLLALGLLMLTEAVWPPGGSSPDALAAAATGARPWWLWAAGAVAGFGIGVVAAVLGVAGGELLIPTLVLLHGLDVKLAGSLSLTISLPTMLVGLARLSRSDAFAVLRTERALLLWMALGSLGGAALGSALVGVVPQRALMALLGALLWGSAYKVLSHAARAG